uniref:DUF2281 domain-containing protein n=1 Tax=Heterorhabditis bacteriophora TaxID=37862 RepID=A0A1I7XUI1_HETBA
MDDLTIIKKLTIFIDKSILCLLHQNWLLRSIEGLESRVHSEGGFTSTENLRQNPSEVWDELVAEK